MAARSEFGAWYTVRELLRMRFAALFSTIPRVANVKSDEFWSIVADLFTHE